MNAAEVPDELVEAAARAVWDSDPAVAEGDGPPWDAKQDRLGELVRDDLRNEMRRALAVALPLDRLSALEGLRAEIATWRPYETRDIGDAFPADTVVDLVQDRIDRLRAAETERTS